MKNYCYTIFIIASTVLAFNACNSEKEQLSAKYKYIPEGSLEFIDVNSGFSVVDDTLKNPFRVYLNLKIEVYYSGNFSLLPIALAESPVVLNRVNLQKTSIIINQPFRYKNEIIEAGRNFLLLEDLQLNLMEYQNTIPFDNKFLSNAQFKKGWTTFTISGELEDGQKFEFEKEVYLDL